MKDNFFNTSSLAKIALGLIIGLGIVSTSTILNGPYAFFNSTWPALVGTIVATHFLIIAQAEVHANKIKANISPIHWAAGVLRVIVAFAICSLFQAYHYNLVKVCVLTLFSIFYFGPVFSINLNERRNLPKFYLGKDGKSASAIDSLFNGYKYGGELLILIELIGMIVSGCIYLK